MGTTETSVNLDKPSKRRLKRETEALIQKGSAFQLSEADYLEVAKVMWASLDTPISLSCALLLKYKEYGQLVTRTVRPQDYCDVPLVQTRCSPLQFRDDYLAVSILAKWPNFEHAELDPVGACKDADLAAEQHCRETNERLSRVRFSPRGDETAYLHLMLMMQADISRVLGAFHPTEWLEACRFGPGKASAQTGTIDYEKLLSRPSVTADFATLGAALIAESTPWLEALSGVAPDVFSHECGEDEMVYTFDVVLEPGDRNRMVPKNAKTMRGIRPQPGLNVFAQLGIGEMIRHRLRLNGLDLDNQTPNQHLAQKGSLPGSTLVTVDLKGASGHIARRLPPFLLETAHPGWLHAMHLTRTRFMLPHGADDSVASENAWVPMESFSAMGNGYTFELETLIFWAAVRACRQTVRDDAPYRVYGDDIICGRKTADLLLPFLDFLGFPLNLKKTFLEGPFRESCGADWWNGTNVRPIFFSVTAEELHEDNSNGTSILRWLQTCNAIRRLARTRNHGLGCDRVLLACWRAAILRIPSDLRCSLKSGWIDDQDTTLITSATDALTNPHLRYCGDLQALVGPRLYGRRRNVTPSSFLGVRATLLYRKRGNRSVSRYDPVWDRWQRVLHKITQTPASQVDSMVRTITGINPGVELHGGLLPARHGLSLGAGWEVFHLVSDDAEWRDVGTVI